MLHVIFLAPPSGTLHLGRENCVAAATQSVITVFRKATEIRH